MQTYNFLPGTIINTVDGGLNAAFAPTDDAVLVLGTSGQGEANNPFQVTDLSVASQEFGFTGSLFKAVAEVASYSDNVIAYRIGASPAVLTGGGLDATGGAVTPGFTITFNTIQANSPAIYQIWYQAGVLAVWNNSQIVFSNQTGAAVDTGDIRISTPAGLSGAAAVAGNVGLPIGSGSTPLITCAITIRRGPFVPKKRKQPTRARRRIERQHATQIQSIELRKRSLHGTDGGELQAIQGNYPCSSNDLETLLENTLKPASKLPVEINV